MVAASDLPSIVGSARTHTAYLGSVLADAHTSHAHMPYPGTMPLLDAGWPPEEAFEEQRQQKLLLYKSRTTLDALGNNRANITPVNITEDFVVPAQRRLVQVFIADPNENVPLEQALLYKGEQKFTDANDQELFFEIDINKLLTEYNEKRVKIIDKRVKERVEYLEPIKIRELKMVVVTIATF